MLTAVDEVLEFCRRALVLEELALEAARAAEHSTGRLERLAAACAAGRELLSFRPLPQGAPIASNGAAGPLAPPPAASLSQAVARELEDANTLLAERHREALALRERLGLSHAEIATVMGIEPSAVAAVLGRARLALRAVRRGALPSTTPCERSEHALVLLARVQDGEAVSSEDRDWLLDHLLVCAACEHAHAAMIEASACYRGWGAGTP